MSDFLKQCGGWTPVPEEIVNHDDLSYQAAYVWGAIWRFCQQNKSGDAKLTHNKIADRCGMSRRTVINHLNDLIKFGFVEDKTPGVLNEGHVYNVTKGEQKIIGMQKLHTSNEETEPEQPEGVQELPIGMQDLPTGCEETTQLGMQKLHKIDSSTETEIQKESVEQKPTTVEEVREPAKAATQRTRNIGHLLETARIRPPDGELEKLITELPEDHPLEAWFQFAIDNIPPGDWAAMIALIGKIKAAGGLAEYREKNTPRSKAYHPAVRLYGQKAKIKPDATTYDLIIVTVGDDPKCLELWGKIVEAWVTSGWNKRNAKGMTDFFKRGEIPGEAKQPNGKQNGSTNGHHEAPYPMSRDVEKLHDELRKAGVGRNAA